MERVRNLAGAALVLLATELAPSSAGAQAARERALLDDVTLARRGSAVLGARIARAEPPAGVLEVDVPDLETNADSDIVSENVRAAAVVYYASQLEELKFFAAADKIAESFASGTLPIGRDNASTELDAYWKARSQRLTERERRALYATVVGAGGTDIGQPNRDFGAFWLRFLASVSAYQRQRRAGEVLDAGAPKQSAESARKAGRDLAANVALHGYGVTRFAAVELQNQIRLIERLLTSPEVLAAYGAKDQWQVIDKVAGQSLGGAANTKRYRTLASDGATLLLWVAKHAKLLLGTNDPGGSQLQQALDDPSVTPAQSAERWLAVSGKTGGEVQPPRAKGQPTLLCLDDKRRLTACKVRKRRSR
jgi:hypothetical protein